MGGKTGKSARRRGGTHHTPERSFEPYFNTKQCLKTKTKLIGSTLFIYCNTKTPSSKPIYIFITSSPLSRVREQAPREIAPTRIITGGRFAALPNDYNDSDNSSHNNDDDNNDNHNKHQQR